MQLCHVCGQSDLRLRLRYYFYIVLLDQTVLVALYNLTSGRGLTQPWCEPSPWGDQSRWVAYIPCRGSAKCLSSVCCQSQFYTLGWWGKHGVHIFPKDVTWSTKWQHWDSNLQLTYSESLVLSIWPPHLHVILIKSHK